MTDAGTLSPHPWQRPLQTVLFNEEQWGFRGKALAIPRAGADGSPPEGSRSLFRLGGIRPIWASELT